MSSLVGSFIFLVFFSPRTFVVLIVNKNKQRTSLMALKSWLTCVSRHMKHTIRIQLLASLSQPLSLKFTLIHSLPFTTSCRPAATMICPRPSSTRGRWSAFRCRADGNVAAVSHGQHVLTPTAAAAWCANTAVSKAAWWSWPWKWYPSHVCSSVPILVFPGLSVLDLGPMYATDRRQTKALLLNAPVY